MGVAGLNVGPNAQNLQVYAVAYFYFQNELAQTE
jgi:hypothetical protein